MFAISKQVLALALAVALVPALLSGCGGGDGSTAPEPAGSAAVGGPGPEGSADSAPRAESGQDRGGSELDKGKSAATAKGLAGKRKEGRGAGSDPGRGARGAESEGGSLRRAGEQIQRRLRRGSDRDLGDLADEVLRGIEAGNCPAALKGSDLCSGGS